MAPKPARPRQSDERSDGYDAFEKAVRKVLSVPKRDLDAEREREQAARRSGNGSK